MYELTTSGKSLADIQTQWHEYYVGLPDNEKHQVWQEFYKNQSAVSRYAQEMQKIPISWDFLPIFELFRSLWA
jgi:hypothetical protein